MNIPAFITFGGILHFGILIASALTPKVLDWRNELRQLHPLCRHVVWTHGAFIVLVIIAFGTLSLTLIFIYLATTYLLAALSHP